MELRDALVAAPEKLKTLTNINYLSSPRRDIYDATLLSIKHLWSTSRSKSDVSLSLHCLLNFPWTAIFEKRRLCEGTNGLQIHETMMDGFNEDADIK